jgi:F420-dependent oxidoreductase-like protein
VRICLMIEGQEDVTWEDWQALALSCENAGLEGLFRSDHYMSVQGRAERASLDAWTTLAALAARTERIRLGTMVSPATFRHPSVLAKSAVTVDHISQGRAELGMGAGWLEAEHRAYGFSFPSPSTRLEMLAEQIEIIHRQWAGDPFSFRGKHYTLEELDALPKPVQKPHPNLIVGGSGGSKSLALAARWADEYNTLFCTQEECARRKGKLLEACEREGRSEPPTLSLMTGCVVGIDAAEVRRRARAVMSAGGETGSEERWLDSVREEWVVGEVDETVEKLGALEDAGIERVMLQHLAHDDLEMVELIGEQIVPALA